MRLIDIWEEVKEATGSTDEQVNFRAVTRAVELLANKGLFDPLVGTIDFSVDNGYLIALPRDVKTPIRLNINSNPSFARSRIYEFAPNGAGSNDEEEIGWQWHERGYSPIMDERKLPSAIKYTVTNAADEGKTCTIIGMDVEGWERTETIQGVISGAIPTQTVFAEIRSIIREQTISETWLAASTGNIARYYPDEEQPEFRVIKLSKTGVAVRMLYRKHVFKITSTADIIPLHSPMAVIRAVDAVRLMQRKKYEDAALVLEEATRMIGEEQNTREENDSVGKAIEVSNAINTNINSNNVLIAADVFDMASEILGPIGKDKIFDRLTDTMNVLANKSQWDSMHGMVDVMRSEACTTGQGSCCKCDGYFVLPRYVGAAISINVNGCPTIPRNRWFEFHLNGTGSRKHSSGGAWDDAGDVAVIAPFPCEQDKTKKHPCKKIVPLKLRAIPENILDDGKKFTIYGRERLADGTEVEIYRNGKPGWTSQNTFGEFHVGPDFPNVVHIERIVREQTLGFVRLVGYCEPTNFLALVGDIGRDNEESNGVATFIKGENPQDIILLGDNNYEDGSADTIDANLGKKFRQYIFPWLGNSTIAPLDAGITPASENHLWPIAGNHDWFGGQPAVDDDDVTNYSDQLPNPYFENPPDPDTGEVNDVFDPPQKAPPAGLVVATVWPDNENKNYLFRFAPSILFFGDWVIDVYDELGFYIERQIASDAGGGEFTVDFSIGSITFQTGTILSDPDTFQFRLKRTFQEFIAASVAPMTDYFVLPGNERYYSKVFGSVEVFFLSSDDREPDGNDINSIQHDWLVAAVAASTAPWKVVCLHHAPYSSAAAHGDDSTLKWDYAALGIHAVIAGHNHVYERFEKENVVYFVVGTGASNLSAFNVNPRPESKVRLVKRGSLFMEASRAKLKFYFMDVDRVVRDTKEFTRDVSAVCEDVTLGYWYPDETEPRYRRIKVPNCKHQCLRIRYRKRNAKITSLHDVLNINSRLAVENMLRAIKAQKDGDPQGAAVYEGLAVQYVGEEQAANNPIISGGLQFDPGTCPANTCNIS